MDYLESHHMNRPAGFIHLPALPEQASKAETPIPSMGLETAVKGISLSIETISRSLEK